MNKFSLFLLLTISLCLVGCSDSGSETVDVPEPPASTEDDLGEASGSAEDMFLDDSATEGEGGSATE